MNSCSICATPEGAAIVNQLLHAGKMTLQQIASECGFSKSAVARHSHGSCTYGYPAFKASLVKNRNRKSVSGRCFVLWPGEPLPDEIAPSDFLLVVRYRETALPDYGNPSGLVGPALIDEARAENATRFPAD